MTAVHLRADWPFYSQWAARGTLPRSLDSGQALQELLSFTPPPSLAVVGSKGKGTAAAAATMTLVSAGLTTVSITSPAFRTNRERIRLNGAALTLSEYERISAYLEQLLPLLPSDTYLSPTGAYTLMGAWWAADIGADVLVIEEGMGGATDEISLFDHTALAVTPIFMEHAGILGDDLSAIATNLLGAGSSSVEVLASGHQSPIVTSLIEQTANSWGASLMGMEPAHHRNPLIGENIGLGRAAGAAFAELLGYKAGEVRALSLLGRSSLHDGPGGQWFVDAAISPAGVKTALAANPIEDPTFVVSWPLSKDSGGCSALVPGAIHVQVPGLPYPDGLPNFSDIAPTLDGNVVALGTISFIAEVLEYVGADTNLW